MLWGLKIRSIFRRDLQRDIDEELRSHIEMRSEELQAGGMDPRQAECEARRSFGNYARTVESTRDVHVFGWLESIGRDVRYGLRRLWREPAFTLTAALTLALAIGANGAIFSVLEALLLRPFPFHAPEQVVLLSQTEGQGTADAGFSIPDFEDLQARTKTLAAVAAFQSQSVNLTGVAEPGRLIGGFVSSSFLPMLGIEPAQGRAFNERDDSRGGPRVCVLNYNVWRDRFGSDPAMLGRVLILNGEAHTVIGILPENFRAVFTNADVWIPLPFYLNYTRNRARKTVTIAARMADGRTLEQVNSELRVLPAGMTNGGASGPVRRFSAKPVRDIVLGNVRGTLFLLIGAAACVLLIGCVNIAGLLMTRALGRQREIAVRASLGASRGRIIRQLLTESALLSAIGGALGVATAYAGMRALSVYCADLLFDSTISLNATVVIYLAAVSVAAGLLFGLAPAFMAPRQGESSLRLRGMQAKQGKLGSFLVAGQVALAFVLLAGAGLMFRTMRNIASIDPGFSPANVLTMEYRVPRNKYSSGAKQVQIHHALAAKVAGVPGVRSAALMGALPFSGNSDYAPVTFPDRADPPASSPWVVQINTATPGLFRTLGVPLLSGRDFSWNDRDATTPVAVVSSGFADRFWPGQSALGRAVRFTGSDGKPKLATVVGIVGNVRHNALDDMGNVQMYVPYAQDPFIFATLVVRTYGDAMSMARPVQQAIWSVDPDQPMWKIRTLRYLVDRSWSFRRYLGWFLAGFASLALLLASIGLYGLLAYSTAQRRPEFGLRLAVGAMPGDIGRMVLGKGMLLTGTGLAAGIVASLYCSRFLSRQVYDVSVSDPAVYSGLCIVLLAVALLATLVPAQRAMRVDPAITLRSE